VPDSSFAKKGIGLMVKSATWDSDWHPGVH